MSSGPALPRPALMLVTEPHRRLVEIADRAISGGVNVVQLRAKGMPSAQVGPIAESLRAITRGRALLLLNSDVEAALRTRADGVHLPEESRHLEEVRRLVGDAGLVGRSVHSIEAARRAEQEGADYLVAGTIFASRSHPDLPPAGLEFLRATCRSVSIPVLAIGGITPETARQCLEAGAAGIAVLSPILYASDPEAAARQYRDRLA